MTAQGHNRILVIIYGLLSALLATGLLTIVTRAFIREGAVTRIAFEDPFLSKAVPIGLAIALLLLSAAYGLMRTRRWARTLALIISGLFIWFYPLGTLLAIYTWWFMRSPGGKQLYSG